MELNPGYLLKSFLLYLTWFITESPLDPCNPNPCHPGVSCVTIWKGSATMFECGLCPDGMIGNGLNCTYTNPCWSNPCRPPKSVCSPSILKVRTSSYCFLGPTIFKFYNRNDISIHTIKLQITRLIQFAWKCSHGQLTL